ncbi:ribosomal protein S7 [Parathielavia hyrcaniae]|uniref:Small ribosomal subunit protein uS7m n=1 Tax=Parathielavia hyrcaniae TaxID=113614 RepID=A0AAN6Q3X4_9PEZI|nr:ribosomal protein S7 [Parathielavia hyrcaniae]
MPPRLNFWSACRALSVRTRALAQRPQPGPATLARGLADNTSSRLPPHDRSGALPPSMLPANEQPTSPENEAALNQLRLIEYGLSPLDPAVEGHKYGLPELPLPTDKHTKHRYDAVIQQITRLLMKDGKLAKAQRDMAMILNYLRTSPPPRLDPSKPLLPGAPPAHHLPLDPVLYLGLAIDSVAPLVKIRGFKGMAGGGKSLDVPMPLRARQRRRTAFLWILDVVNRKPSKGSGRTMFPHRVAEEIVAVVEGRSGVWDRRTQVHKLGTANRANLNNEYVKGKL